MKPGGTLYLIFRLHKYADYLLSIFSKEAGGTLYLIFIFSILGT